MSRTMLKVPVSEADHRQGPLSAPVVLVEYGDFECPHCAAALTFTDRLKEEFGAKICFVYRHYPLTDLHPRAMLAAIAAEAADQQNRFWPMHHALLENYGGLSIETLFSIARGLDLDLGKFESDLSRPDLIERVRRDIAGAERSHLHGTPTFFLNGQLLEGSLNYRQLKQAMPGAGPLI